MTIAPSEPENAQLSDEQARAIIGDSKVLQHISDIVSLVDRDMRWVYISRVVGNRTRAGLKGVSLSDHMSEQTRSEFAAAFRLAFHTGEPQMIEGESNDGVWYETRLAPVGSPDRTRYMLCVSTDITRRKLAEAALRDSERRLRDAIDVSGLGTWRWEREQDQLFWDAGMCRIFGLSIEDAPQHFAEYVALLHPDDRDRVTNHIDQAMKSSRFDEIEHRVVRPNGEVRSVSCRASVVYARDGAPAGMHGGVFDVTVRRALEERLRHAHKMEAIGQLTAGIAHNFNNLLSIMSPNVELVRPHCGADAQVRLDDIEHAAQRAADVVRQLMLFSRREINVAKESSDLSAILRRTVRICRATFDPRITITLAIEDNLPRIVAATGEIEQLLLNICINARDALRANLDGNAKISLHAQATEDSRVRVHITDNGVGMDEVTRARVFEPFFTTKSVGHGTGLGLASAYAIVADHHGTIRCASTPEAGTTFTIDLPRSDSLPVTVVTPAFAQHTRASETVLLVDDEPMVRRALTAVLEGAGHTVLTAADGQEGLAMLERAEGAGVRLVVLDRAMPHASGDYFLQRFRAQNRRIPVLLLTGHPGIDADDLGVSAVLLKPPSTSVLLRTIRQLIDAEPALKAP